MDPRLVVRAQKGDESAFAVIARDVHGRFKQVAYRILRDPYLAEDAMQQALVEIWRKLPQLRDPERFDAWSHRILVHACYREGERYRGAIAEPIGDWDLVGPDDASRTVGDRDQLERGFRRLSLEHRAVLVTHYFLDLSIEDTADALDISVGTAKSRLNRALDKLRLALHADAPFPAPRDRGIVA